MLRNFVLLLPLVLLSLTVPAGAQNRLLLIFAPHQSDARWQRQDALLAGSKAQFRELDLRRFNVFDEANVKSVLLRKRYHVKSGQFRVLLIGKDGHVAFNTSSPVTLSETTEQIDRMPMRRAEMRRQGARR